MDQDEEMDTTPLAQPFFMIDKEKEADCGGEGKQGREDSDSGEDEDPHVTGEEEEEEEDNEVSVTQKAPANDGQLENGEGAKTNGNHLTESEESSDEEEDQTSVRVMKCLPVRSIAQRQTLTS